MRLFFQLQNNGLPRRFYDDKVIKHVINNRNEVRIVDQV